jgi:hypothetical protein
MGNLYFKKREFSLSIKCYEMALARLNSANSVANDR